MVLELRTIPYPVAQRKKFLDIIEALPIAPLAQLDRASGYEDELQQLEPENTSFVLIFTALQAYRAANSTLPTVT